MRAATVVLTLAVCVGVARAQAPAALDPQSQQALEHYLQNPEQNRREVLQLASRGLDNLPLPVLMVLADAQLRTGRSGAARQYFDQILQQYPDSPAAAWAETGLGWAALAHGDLDTARMQFQRGVEGGNTDPLGNVMIGLIDASSGDPASALQRLDKLAADPAVTSKLGDSLALYDGYARYWAGDLQGAEAAFARVAANDPSSTAADDARYATALARARLGDTTGAAEMLGQMSNASSTRKASPGALVDLDPRALIRSTFRRYRHHGVSDSPGEFLQGDGRTLARASARRHGRRRDGAAANGPGDGFVARSARAGGGGVDGGGVGSGAATSDPAGAGTPGSRGRASGGDAARGPGTSAEGGWRTPLLVGLVVLVAAALLLRRRTA